MGLCALTSEFTGLRGFSRRSGGMMGCAQHGRDVMGWKSPVGVPTWTRHKSMITTSRRQGQDREGLFGGSRSAKVRGDGQKLHRRPGLRASWPQMTKPIGDGGQGKCSACARKHRVLTWGDLFGVAMRGCSAKPEGVAGNPDPGVAVGCRPQTSEHGSVRCNRHSAAGRDFRRDRAEVSRGRSSCRHGAKGRT